MARGSTNEIFFLARLIATSKCSTRLVLLKTINSEQCEYLRQMFYNVLLNSSVSHSPGDKSYLRRNIRDIRLLASKRVCRKDKKKLLVKKQALVARVCKIVVRYLS